VLVTFAKTKLSTEDVYRLLPEYDRDAIRSALRDLKKNPAAYPHISRTERGCYVYDPNKSAAWMTFPTHNRYSKKAVKIKPVKAAAPQAVEVAQVAEAKAERILSDVTNFVEMLPVYDREQGLLSMDEQVLLRDSQGRFWHAERV
jgi:hypothetical protein